MMTIQSLKKRRHRKNLLGKKKLLDYGVKEDSLLKIHKNKKRQVKQIWFQKCIMLRIKAPPTKEMKKKTMTRAWKKKSSLLKLLTVRKTISSHLKVKTSKNMFIRNHSVKTNSWSKLEMKLQLSSIAKMRL